MVAYKNHVNKGILMSTHNLCFYGNHTKIIQLPSNTHPTFGSSVPYHISTASVSSRDRYTLRRMSIAGTTSSHCHIIHRVVVFFLDINTTIKYSVTCKDKMSHVVRKPAFCICENKEADQRIQRLCFRYMDSTIPLLP